MTYVDDSVVVYTLPDGWYVVELLTHYDYLREGGLMGNCVLKYWDSPHTVYSLRSPKHEPHASILFQGHLVTEIAGRHNTSLKPRYREMVDLFFAAKGYTISPIAYSMTELRRRTMMAS